MEWKWKWFLSFYISQVTLREVRACTWGRTPKAWSRNHRTMMLTSLLSLFLYTFIYIYIYIFYIPGPSIQEWYYAHWSEPYLINHQLRKCLPGLPTGQSDGKHIIRRDSLFPDTCKFVNLNTMRKCIIFTWLQKQIINMPLSM